MTKVRRWNTDKPHRCPGCHTIVERSRAGRRRRLLPSRPSAYSWVVYECCQCGAHFARWPPLALLLPLRRCQGLTVEGLHLCRHPQRDREATSDAS